MHKIPMTIEGAKKLQEELVRLKTKERPKIVKAIAEARAHGDLKENAEYHAAKELQGLTEARIRDIENKLANVQIIDITKIPKTDRVVFGATVELYDVTNKQNITYKIVGDEEADIKESKVSVHSPLARALIGKQTGDSVEIKTPSGPAIYEIVNINYV